MRKKLVAIMLSAALVLTSGSTAFATEASATSGDTTAVSTVVEETEVSEETDVAQEIDVERMDESDTIETQDKSTSVADEEVLEDSESMPVYETQSKSGNFSSSYTLTGNGATDICSVALAQYEKTGSQLGYTEDWCADFVSDCAKLAGQSSAIPANGGVSGIYQNILNAGGSKVSSPQKGDIVIMDWSGSGGFNHVEIVYSVSGSTVNTIGGNSGRNTSSLYTSEVWKHSYSVSSSYFTCFVRPNYTNTVTATTSGVSMPDYISPETNLSLTGTVSSNSTITWLWIGVKNYGTQTHVIEASTNLSATSYDISSLASQLNFKSLSTGKYTLTIEGMFGGTYKTVYSKDFEVLEMERPVVSLSSSSVDLGETATLTWTKVDGATQYVLDGWHNGEEIVWKDITNLSSVDVSYTEEGKYSFFVIAMKGSAKSTSVGVTLKVQKPVDSVTGLKIGGRAADALRLNWTKNTSADGYIIEQYKNSKWTRIARIASNSTVTYRVSGLSAGTTYKFRVKAFTLDDSGEANYSKYTSISGKTNPSTVTGLKIGGRATDALRLNWTENSKASGYIIEQYKSGSWKRIAKITDNSTTTYRVEGLSAYTTYKFRIKAYAFDGSTAIYSGYKTISGKTVPKAVTGLKIGGKAKNALRLNWTKNSKASGYIIEQNKNGTWTRIAKISSNSTVTYRVGNLSSKKTYMFRVRAYGFDGTTAIYSSYKYISGKTN